MNSEISTITSNNQTGLVRSVSVTGKAFNDIPADAVVLCTGAHTATLLYNALSVFAPLMPIKSYTFDMRTQNEFRPCHLRFMNSALTAVSLEPGTWRISAFGDIAGLNTDLDNRRVRTAKNVTCVTIDTSEGLMA